MKIYGTKKLDQKGQMHKCLSVFQNNLSKFLVTCLELGTNYKIALHEQVDAIGQEKGANMKTRETIFFIYVRERNPEVGIFSLVIFFRASVYIRPSAVTTSLKV